jgi:hypothetical protein
VPLLSRVTPPSPAAAELSPELSEEEPHAARAREDRTAAAVRATRRREVKDTGELL